MEGVNKIFNNFNVKNKNSQAYLYCLKNEDTCGSWLKHFYETENTNNNSDISENDKNGIIRSEKMNRFKHYTDFLDENNDEYLISTIYNCFSNQIIEHSV